MNILFICSKNEWRSRTAETIFRHDDRFAVRSAGTSRTARLRVHEKMIEWADTIFAMEYLHKERLQDDFYRALVGKELIVLDILDEYPYMNEELIEELRDAVDYYFEDRS